MAKENNNTAFKSTSIGLIPKDWDIIQIGEIGTLFKGKGIAKTEVVEEGLPCIRYAELYTKYNTKFTNTFSFCNEESALFSQKIINGDIVFAGSGETLEDIGKCAVYLGDSVAYAGGDTIILRPEKVDSTYLSYLLNYDSVVKQRSVLGQGNSVVHIYPKGIATILVQIPPTKEQTKIAQILSTCDVAIETLQQLIAKKERRKKALMQKLLTGKIRFKEFKGEKWMSISLDKMALIIMGQSPLSEAYNEDGNGLPLIQGNADLKERKTTPRIYTSEITKECKVGDIILTVRAPVGAVAKSFHNACIGRGVCALRANTVDAELLYYLLLEYEPKWKSLEQGSTFTAVNSNDIKSLEFKVSTNIKEQTKIASVLSAADEEIQTLKISLAHYKQQKQGLMQVLLTGKKRVKI